MKVNLSGKIKKKSIQQIGTFSFFIFYSQYESLLFFLVLYELCFFKTLYLIIFRYLTQKNNLIFILCDRKKIIYNLMHNSNNTYWDQLTDWIQFISCAILEPAAYTDISKFSSTFHPPSRKIYHSVCNFVFSSFGFSTNTLSFTYSTQYRTHTHLDNCSIVFYCILVNS